MMSLQVASRMLAFAAALLIGCAGPIRAETTDELYQKAKAEGSVVLYGAGPTGSHDRWIKEFEQRFPGVAVTFTGGLSTALNKKIDAQLANRKVETDVAILQTIQDFARWKKAGAMLLFKPSGSDQIDEAYKDEDGAFTTVSVYVITYATNTQLVPPADVPKSALDFLKPLFAGKLITTDPIDDDAALAVFASIVEKYGWGYMDKYAAQKPAFVTTGHAAVSNAIVAGEKLASFVSTSSTFVMQRAGKPIAPAFSQGDFYGGIDRALDMLFRLVEGEGLPPPGASGAAAAWSLAETKMRIVCLEQGDWQKPSEYPSSGRDWEARQHGDYAISPNRRGRDTDYPINDSNSPIKIANFNGVGGGNMVYLDLRDKVKEIGREKVLGKLEGIDRKSTRLNSSHRT
mgnify:CR=1 FL=1